MELVEKELFIGQNYYKYYETGSGDYTTFFLHGFGASKKFYLDVVAELSEHSRCILVDMPGHNGVPLGQTSFQELVNYYIELINQLGGQHVFLVGYSVGGILTLEICNQIQTIEKAVVWTSPIIGVEKGLRNRIKAIFPILKEIPSDLFANAVQNETLNRIINNILTAIGATSPIYFEEVSKLRLETALKLLDILKTVSVKIQSNTPKLFIFDELDPVVSPKNIQYALSCADKKSIFVKEINRSGHFKSKKGTKQATELLSSFLFNTPTELQY